MTGWDYNRDKQRQNWDRTESKSEDERWKSGRFVVTKTSLWSVSSLMWIFENDGSRSHRTRSDPQRSHFMYCEEMGFSFTMPSAPTRSISAPSLRERQYPLFPHPLPLIYSTPPLVLTLLSSHISPGTEQCSSISSVSVSVSLDGIFIVSILKWYWTYLSLTPSLSRSLSLSSHTPVFQGCNLPLAHVKWLCTKQQESNHGAQLKTLSGITVMNTQDQNMMEKRFS